MRLRAGCTRSIRLRLTLWYSAAVALIVLAFSCGLYLLVRQGLFGQAESQLAMDMAALSKVIADDPDDLHEIDEYGSIAYFQVRHGQQVVFESTDWRRHRIGSVTPPADITSTSIVHSPSGEEFLLRTETIPAAKRASKYLATAAPGAPVEVTVATDIEPIDRSLHSLLFALALGIPCAVVASVVGGYLLAGRALAPIGAVARKAAQITADNLGERLPVENPHDEIGQLAGVFNGTLARIEDAFDRLRRFTTDASHELRTPLAAIRSVGEVALRGNGADNCREVIGSILEEVDRLTRLVDGLLVLTRGDLSRPYLRRETIDLVAVAREVVELLRVLAEEKGQTLGFENGKDILATAERATLRQCLLNLIDNAIKYTPPGGRIRVTVGRDPQGLPLVEVADTGPGIAPEDQKRIFDRFYRASESVQTRGAGLGLAIARWAAELNGGRIELDSGLGRGSTFQVILPEGGDARGGSSSTTAHGGPLSEGDQ